MRFLSSLLIAVVTRTLVRAHHVLADAVGADAAGPGTFVDVCKRPMKISHFSPPKSLNTIQSNLCRIGGWEPIRDLPDTRTGNFRAC